MRISRLTDDDIAALLRGTAPHGRPELEPLAVLVEDLGRASSESAPRPSAAMATLLESGSFPGISDAAMGGPSQRSDHMPARASASAAPRRGIASMFISWFTGLGLVAKIVLGASAAALGLVGAGAAHALPPGIQNHFDELVQTVVPADDETGGDDATDTTGADDDSVTEDSADDTAETDDSGLDGVGDDDGTEDQGPTTEHAQGVTEAAHDDSTEGREHGEAVSDAAHQNRGSGSANSGPGKAEDRADDDSADDGVEHESGDDDSVEHESGDDDGVGHESGEGEDSSGSNSGSGSSGSDDSGRGKRN